MPAKLRAAGVALLVGAVLLASVAWSVAGPGTAAQAAVTVQSADGACLQPVAESESGQFSLKPLSPGLVSQQPWAQQRLAPSRVWPLTTGTGVTVAVIDTGVDVSNQQLSAHGLVMPGYDAVRPGQPADDDCAGHGTLVAGIIAAQQRPGVGMAGVAPGATILPVRQTDCDRQGQQLTCDQVDPSGAQELAAAINDAVAQHASVINISVVTASPDAALADAVSNAIASNVVVVAAAGNDGSGPNSVKEYPAAYPGVLSVGAVGQDGQLLSFSSTATPVSVVAPGEGIVGPAAGSGGTGLLVGQGTSFAAPFVAGVVALVRSYYPTLSAQQVVARIEATADHPAGAMPDPTLGWGEVDPYAAVTALLPSPSPSAPAGQAAVAVPPRQGSAGGGDAGLALLIAIGAVGLAALAAAMAALAPYGRRRGWRPGRWDPGGSRPTG